MVVAGFKPGEGGAWPGPLRADRSLISSDFCGVHIHFHATAQEKSELRCFALLYAAFALLD